MLTHLVFSFRSLLFFTLVCGVVYPVAVTLVSQIVFQDTANGSLVKNARGETVGSSLIAQKFVQPHYFWPRPSAADYSTVASGASNLSPTSSALKEAVEKRASAFGSSLVEVPADLLMASGSGLDPHISREAALFQTGRVAQARGMPVAQIEKFIDTHAHPLAMGNSSGDEMIVNVLELNLAIDEGNGR